MKILVLGGSPNRKGSTQLLIDSFQQGAEEAGHTVTVLNAAHMNVHPCTGCIACGYNDHRMAKSIEDSIDFAAKRHVWQRMIL